MVVRQRHHERQHRDVGCAEAVQKDDHGGIARACFEVKRLDPSGGAKSGARCFGRKFERRIEEVELEREPDIAPDLDLAIEKRVKAGRAAGEDVEKNVLLPSHGHRGATGDAAYDGGGFARRK